MHIIDKIIPLQAMLSPCSAEGQRIALVPTMGNLHAGHLSLVKKAKQVAEKVVVSVFVNPTQFVQGEDYETYPRTFDEDREKLAVLETDILFHPKVDEIYQDDSTQNTRIIVPALENIFCGLSRPGHFSGVATVVTKLFNIVQPNVAIFGEKDYQQLLLIKKIVQDLFLRVEIIGMPTIREADGLAMSSRNIYLDTEERKNAPVLYQTLKKTTESINAGNCDYSDLEKKSVNTLNQSGFKTEYFSVRDAKTLGEPGNDDLVILAAAQLGKARLIDNVTIRR